ncbi:MAG: PucR family transcriptional regulator ligand-binding domain-containing protein [Chloroflexi bacterium]|nr:PucR family transcriptional regulator ligand-binding domain-containing protein [Chloroflexota bacterium]
MRDSSITLRRALDLPPLQHARVLAGNAGIEHRVRHVNVMEVPDILPWVQPDELLLTTAYPLRDDHAALGTLVPELAAKGLAGIAIKPDRYLGKVPTAMLIAADACSFPLIELPPESSFNEIISAVLSVILNEQSLRLQRAAEIHDRFTQIVLGGGGLREIAMTLAQLVERQVLIVDQHGEVLTGSGELDIERLTDEVMMAAHGDGAEAGRWVSVKIGGREATLQPIMVDGEPYGAIAALAPAETMSTDDLEALQFAATVAALRQVQARALVEGDRRFQAVCLEELVSGHLTDRSVLSERAEAFGWDLSLPRAVLLAQAGSSSGGDADTVRSLADAARVALGGAAIVWERSTQAAALVAPRGADPAALLDAADSLRREAARRLPTMPVSIGIGRVRGDPLELRESHAEARRALEVGRWRSPGEVVTFERMGLDRLLASVSAPELSAFRHTMIEPLAAYDRAHRSNLLDTLEAYVATRNAAEAARRLYVHYNTVRSRLARIEELIGPFLADTERLTGLAVALHIHRRGH